MLVDDAHLASHCPQIYQQEQLLNMNECNSPQDPFGPRCHYQTLSLCYYVHGNPCTVGNLSCR